MPRAERVGLHEPAETSALATRRGGVCAARLLLLPAAAIASGACSDSTSGCDREARSSQRAAGRPQSNAISAVRETLMQRRETLVRSPPGLA